MNESNTEVLSAEIISRLSPKHFRALLQISAKYDEEIEKLNAEYATRCADIQNREREELQAYAEKHQKK